MTHIVDMAVKEKIPCDCSKVIKENQLDIKNNDEVFDGK
jgi:hypothetical protein